MGSGSKPGKKGNKSKKRRPPMRKAKDPEDLCNPGGSVNPPCEGLMTSPSAKVTDPSPQELPGNISGEAMDLSHLLDGDESMQFHKSLLDEGSTHTAPPPRDTACEGSNVDVTNNLAAGTADNQDAPGCSKCRQSSCECMIKCVLCEVWRPPKSFKHHGEGFWALDVREAWEQHSNPWIAYGFFSYSHGLKAYLKPFCSGKSGEGCKGKLRDLHRPNKETTKFIDFRRRLKKMLISTPGILPKKKLQLWDIATVPNDEFDPKKSLFPKQFKLGFKSATDASNVFSWENLQQACQTNEWELIGNEEMDEVLPPVYKLDKYLLCHEVVVASDHEMRPLLPGRQGLDSWVIKISQGVNKGYYMCACSALPPPWTQGKAINWDVYRDHVAGGCFHATSTAPAEPSIAGARPLTNIRHNVDADYARPSDNNMQVDGRAVPPSKKRRVDMNQQGEGSAALDSPMQVDQPEAEQQGELPEPDVPEQGRSHAAGADAEAHESILYGDPDLDRLVAEGDQEDQDNWVPADQIPLVPTDVNDPTTLVRPREAESEKGDHAQITSLAPTVPEARDVSSDRGGASRSAVIEAAQVALAGPQKRIGMIYSQV